MGRVAAYVLESKNEFERLQRQSETPAYDFRQELTDIIPLIKKLKPVRMLDAGCGSGIVTKYLASVFHDAEIHGCDASDQRVEQARESSKSIHNLKFEQEDLQAVSYPSNHFDFIVCRYVLQHMLPRQRLKALKEMQRCLRPGGMLCVIDMDGVLYNLSPVSKKLSRQLAEISKSDQLDLCVGRKIPALLHEIDLQEITWNIQTLNFKEELLRTEIRLMTERLEFARDFFATALGSNVAALNFRKNYLKAMAAHGSTLFYNKFIVTAKKQELRLVKA